MRVAWFLLAVGCGPDAPVDGPTDLALPPANARFDYQLGGAYTPADGVEVVSRDRNAPAEPGLYNICYVNGFQIQPDEESFWLAEHPDLILRNNGEPVIDVEWDEMLIDVSTPDKRTAVAAIVDEWIAGCAAAGYRAIEIDNLDSFTRSEGLLDEANAVDMMRSFADSAHARNLAAAQKNSAELVARKAELGTDFVVAEECNTFDECDVYTAGYAEHVIVIEYQTADFTTGCTRYPELSIVLRDLDLVTPDDGAYVHDDC